MQFQRGMTIGHGLERSHVHTRLKALKGAADVCAHLLQEVATADVVPVEVTQAQLRAAL
ncbi:hypothetical protein D3C76_1422520 [compost metagenome]